MTDKDDYKKRNIRYNKNQSMDQSKDCFFDNLLLSKNADENWLTTKKAAAFLGITANALRIRVHRGQVQAFNLGTHLRFSLSSLKMLLIKKEF